MQVSNARRPFLDAALWALVVVWAALVVVTSIAQPGRSGVPMPPDKLMHYVAYTGLTMSTLLAAVWAPVRGEGRFPTAPLPIVVLSFLYGVAIEVVQGPIPGRDAELLDALANAAGAVTALLLWMLWRMAKMSEADKD